MSGMYIVKSLSPLERRKAYPWRSYVFDSMLACVGTMLVTIGIFMWHLYPRIPNISVVYLLVVIGLASTRGRYAAIFAAILAFLAFDYFIVPPLFTFVMYRPEEWIALVVFLIDALLTGQLAALLRLRAREASRRERETHLLYDLVRIASSEDQPEQQLQAIAQAIVKVFSSWGVHDCAILQPDARGKIQVQTSAYQVGETQSFSRDENALISWVMANGRGIGLLDNVEAASTSPTAAQTAAHENKNAPPTTQEQMQGSVRLLPMKVGQKIVGVLRLRVLDDPSWTAQQDMLAGYPDVSQMNASFFWTFLDQAVTLIEQVRLRRENLRIELLQRTDMLRAALLSSVSHDLRTPLTSIKAAASSLLQEDVLWEEEARRGFASLIEREADRLNRLVGNLLDLSRIEEGALKLDKDWYQLAELIYEVLDRLQPTLQGRNIEVIVPETLPLMFVDYLALDQVLTNLLENAVRYTPSSSPITIYAAWDGTNVSIRIADRGLGIAPHDLEHIFDKFYRVLNQPRFSSQQATAGSGLGLAVCRGLVEAHEGRLWAESQQGEGTVFCITLPTSSQKEG